MEPLFLPNDFQVFDRFLDGDPYENEEYIAHFRVILQALKNQTPVRMGITNRLGKQVGFCFIPEALEYSEKNDKFRVVAQAGRRRLTINLAKIEYCRHFHGEYVKQDYPDEDYKRTVVIELKDDRNALERIMMAFSYYEKEAEKIDETTYRLRIIYDVEDETEVLIQLLSFGPVLKVVEPESFIKLIKDRLLRQKSCEL